MLKKRKHRFKRRNTEPTVNHPMVLSTPSAGPAVPAIAPPPPPPSVHTGGGTFSTSPIGGQSTSPGPGSAARGDLPPQPPVNLADICDSPTHATAV